MFRTLTWYGNIMKSSILILSTYLSRFYYSLVFIGFLGGFRYPFFADNKLRMPAFTAVLFTDV